MRLIVLGERRRPSLRSSPAIRGQRRARLLPVEHDELMSKHEQLDVFSELAAPASDHQAQHSREGEISERKEHAPDAPIARYRAQDDQERRSWTWLMSCEAQRDLVVGCARVYP
jgi:hypothetical protein